MSGFKPIKPTPTPVPKPAPPIDTTPPTDAEIVAARQVLQAVLPTLRWDHSGGYPQRIAGRWAPGQCALPHVTPTQLDILFRFAGVTPDEIESRGDCADCANADNGHERGYAPPCNSCLRPYHDQFVPATRVVARGPGYHKFTAGDRQAIKRKMVPARKPKR